MRSRGSTLLVVLALLLIVTTSVATVLVMVGREASLQEQTRREVEAFFAAEAGLAEARERMRLLADATPNFTTYTPVMSTLPEVAGIGANGESWYEVIAATPYRLTTTGAELALDSTVHTSNRELTDPDGQPFADYPQAARVRYRVFLRDDVDETPANPASDTNGQVWLVAIGEVDVGGGMPIRRVTQALVAYSPGTARVDCMGQKGGCADKTNSGSLDARTPSLAGVRSL